MEKLGIITNYKQLHKRVIWIILKWFAIAISLTSVQITFLKKKFEYDIITAIYITLVLNHCCHITLIGDLTMMNIIGYVGAKFNQINEYLKNMANNNKYGTTQDWDDTVLHTPQRFAKTPSNKKWMIWIIMQLHLELRKISREVDSLYGVEMTIKMGCYFIFMALDLNNIFHVIFIRNYTNFTLLYSIIIIFWCSHNALKLVVINLVCEKVSSQANSTKNFLNKLSYSMNDVETCENISQLLLHIKQSPLKFNGIGLFQMGYKFIYGFVASVGTVLVILAQAHTESESLFQKI
ncbi:uncharacterized protein [Linepithema humile]|uniref:uncharacterized protein n=1 Tax=Linepithema humile TaxID=83485 RepID=UPI00351EAD13